MTKLPSCGERLHSQHYYLGDKRDLVITIVPYYHKAALLLTAAVKMYVFYNSALTEDDHETGSFGRDDSESRERF